MTSRIEGHAGNQGDVYQVDIGEGRAERFKNVKGTLTEIFRRMVRVQLQLIPNDLRQDNRLA